MERKLNVLQSVEYLTIHDIIWINNTVTGEGNRCNYVTLEAAMAAQYPSNRSQDIPAQAANFLDRLVSSPPFVRGTKRTAFISLLTFLDANGYAAQVNDAEAAKMLVEVVDRTRTPQDLIAQLAAPAEKPVPATMPLRKLILHECNLHVEALKILSDND